MQSYPTDREGELRSLALSPCPSRSGMDRAEAVLTGAGFNSAGISNGERGIAICS